MANAFDYSQTPASNTSAAPDGAAEDIPPSAVNNIMRKMMANIAGLNKVYTATGTGDAQVVTFDPAPAAWTTTTFFYFRPVAANTTTATISNGVSAKTLKLPDAATNLPAGYLQPPNVYGVWFDGTNAVIVDAPGIIKRGSTADGNYTKYSDGTMEQWGTSTQAIPVTTANGSIYRSTSFSITFPESFSSTQRFLVDAQTGTLWATINGAATTTGASFVLMAGASTASADQVVDWYAIGRWY